MEARLLAYDPAEELLAELDDVPSARDLDPDASARLSPELVARWIEDARHSVPAEISDETWPSSGIRPAAAASTPPAPSRALPWLLAAFIVTLVSGLAFLAFTLVR
jgi:hypothetical protein